MRKVFEIRSFYYCQFLVLFLLLTFGCKATQIMSEENTKQENTSADRSSDETVSIPELEKFIFKPDEFRNVVVPRRFVPAEVAKFLLQKIDKTKSYEVFVQVELVADFYDTTEIVEKFRQFLEKKEASSEEVRRSIVITKIIATLGSPEDVEFAKNYYKYLVQKIDTIEDFEEIILLHERLGLGIDSSALRQKLQSKLASLETKKAGDYDARLDYLKLQGEIEAKIRGVEQVQPIKDKVLRMTDRKQRLEEEIKVYAVTGDYGFVGFLTPWSARRIRRETWGSQPAEQIKRTENAALREDVVKALRAFLAKADKLPDLDGEEKEFVKLRIIRAIKFFNGKLSAEEEGVLSHSKGKQVDILANEGFQLL